MLPFLTWPLKMLCGNTSRGSEVLSTNCPGFVAWRPTTNTALSPNLVSVDWLYCVCASGTKFPSISQTSVTSTILERFAIPHRLNTHLSFLRGNQSICVDFIIILKSVWFYYVSVQFSGSVVSDSLWPPWTAASQTSLSTINSWSLLKLTFIELVNTTKHLKKN